MHWCLFQQREASFRLHKTFVSAVRTGKCLHSSHLNLVCTVFFKESSRESWRLCFLSQLSPETIPVSNLWYGSMTLIYALLKLFIFSLFHNLINYYEKLSLGLMMYVIFWGVFLNISMWKSLSLSLRLLQRRESVDHLNLHIRGNACTIKSGRLSRDRSKWIASPARIVSSTTRRQSADDGDAERDCLGPNGVNRSRKHLLDTFD